MRATDEPAVLRASDLIGRRVRASDGEELTITGLRAVQDGPVRGTMATFRVVEVIANPPRRGEHLGYRGRPQNGPWLLAVISKWTHRHTRTLDWAEVRDQLL
jgi:hypothetical protein